MNFSNEAVAANFNMTLSSNGFQAIDERGRAHFLSDLRQRMMKESKKKTKKVINKAPSITAEEHLIQLNSDFDYQWDIRVSQPGLDIEELGLKFYFVGGNNDNHQLGIMSTNHTNDELKSMFQSYNLLKRPHQSGILIGSLHYDQVIEIVNIIIDDVK